MRRSLVHFRAEEPRAPARYRPWVSLASTEEVIRRMAPSGCRGGVSYVFSHDQSQEKFRPVSSQIGFFLQPAQRNAPGHIVPAGPSLPLANNGSQTGEEGQGTRWPEAMWGLLCTILLMQGSKHDLLGMWVELTGKM